MSTRLAATYTPVYKLASRCFFPQARTQTGFFRQSTRLTSFSEEQCRWDFSKRQGGDVAGHGAKQLCVGQDEDAIHLLSTSSRVFGIASCVPHENKEQMQFLDLSETLPVDDTMQMLPTNVPRQLALFLPSYDALFFVNSNGMGKSRMLRMPPPKRKWSMSSQQQQQQQTIYPAEVLGKYYLCGGDFVRILDDEEMITIPLPQSALQQHGGGWTIRPIGGDEFIVEFGGVGGTVNRRGYVASESGEWVWHELESSSGSHQQQQQQQHNRWSSSRPLGTNSTSFIQALQVSDNKQGGSVQVLHSPRDSVAASSATVAFSNQLMCTAFPTHLEVVSLAGGRTVGEAAVLRTIPTPPPSSSSPVTLLAISDNTQFVYAVSSPADGDIVRVSKYETNAAELADKLAEWRKMWGLPALVDAAASSALSPSGRAQLEATKPPAESSQPKHGKTDDKQHVGGNTWAGGTGGSDTAGLGGRGGPYRLDKGHPVHQLSDEQKRQVDQSVLDKARALNRMAFEERMREIGMSGEAHGDYTLAKHRVQIDLERLRSILHQSTAQRKERVWAKHQSFGELDDAKLVDGLCGERQIYKRRVMKPPSLGSVASKPLNVRIVVDVSASMYRFQSLDGRLQRMVDTVLMLLEALQGAEMQSRFRVSIAGHSGESENVDFVTWDGDWPDNEAKVWRVLEEMKLHSQYCMSGDTTVQAIQHAVKEVARQDEDGDGGGEGLVIVVSDANLQRYGIAPKELARAMTSSSSTVQAHVVFIASVRDEAEKWARELPIGRARVCLDTGDLPHIMRDILLECANNQQQQ